MKDTSAGAVEGCRVNGSSGREALHHGPAISCAVFDHQRAMHFQCLGMQDDGASGLIKRVVGKRDLLNPCAKEGKLCCGIVHRMDQSGVGLRVAGKPLAGITNAKARDVLANQARGGPP